MGSKTIAVTSRWTLTALALITVLALVFGLQPRVLAQEVGVAPIESGRCFLCDGSVSAAAMAAPAESVLPAALVTMLFAALLLPTLVAATGLHGRATVAPPLPPPRG
ncbi:MAG: hypothetical protein AB7R89_24950 [Dehalococcoidia bacterium]